MTRISAFTDHCRRLILNALIGLFGVWQWQPPQWLNAVNRLRRDGFRYLRTRPVPVLLGLAAMLLAFGVGWFGYHWWQARPQPVTIDFEVTAPPRTEIEKHAAPHPLKLAFSASVAPLSQVGKEVREGIAIEPPIAGQWRWIDDKHLYFRPTGDWPVAQQYRVKLDKSLVAAQIQLARWEFGFAAPAFEATLEKAEFYRDPVDPELKKAVIHLRFSHPVATQSLEKHLRLQLRNKTDKPENASDLPYTVLYDKLKLNAYIHSEPLPVPRYEQQVLFALAAGVEAEGSDAGSGKPLNTSVFVPGIYDPQMIGDMQLTVAPNNQTQQQDQILLLSTKVPVHEQETAKAVQTWLLPEYHPNTGEGERTEAYSWDVSEVTPEILKLSTPVPLQALSAEREYSETHSFRLQADVGRRLFVSVSKGLKSFGGYVLPEPVYQVLQVPEFTKELRIMGEGALLTLSGEKKIALMTRDLAGVKVELGRILPEQVQHLVSQTSGDFAHPEFYYGEFGQDNMSERIELALPLPATPHGRPHYQPVDLSQYMTDAAGQGKRGIFLLTAQSYDPNKKNDASDEDAETSDDGGVEDRRLIVVTDLGIVVKTELDGSQVVFVQSIQTGQPQSGAEVEVIGKNGLALFKGQTDAAGKIRFAKLAGLEREREPMLYLVRYQGDMSFLPLGRKDRELDFSRFNIGGIENATDANQLNAYLFSDRGLYRPGETFHIGVIVKAEHWSVPLAGIPLQAEILDARGLVAQRSTLNVGPGGFNELSYTTQEASPTGPYTVNLYTVKNGKTAQLLGSTKVKVEEFQPDRMKVAARFSQPPAAGWIHPKDLQAIVNAQNLYGAPAEARRVEAELTLKPALAAFKAYRDYLFYDPHHAQGSVAETLQAAQTDAQGNATFALGLEKYAQATYQLHFAARAFEAQGGRSVAAEADALVSDRPFLLGYKADGALDFIAKNALRNVQVLAVDAQLRPAAQDKLKLQWLERKVLSVLTRQEDGTYRYESRAKENTLQETPLAIPREGLMLPLNSAAPGDYAYVIRDAEGLLLSRIEYSVAGQGNVSRTLDRHAELQLTLDKQEYAAGETINVSIRAPYTGTGLITVERDKVYASRWFRADTQASVQSIELPKELEGNAYVTVQFIRGPGSDEIFMSPLSYGVAPFKINLAEHTQNLTLSAPERIKPGEELAIKVHSPDATRVVVFAVDEGILQVARYKNPDPLGYFFRKRQLEVDTTQILDLILPELKKLLTLAAPGGDGEDEAASYLNPFKRKHDQPAVYWSGIVDLSGEREFRYRVPDTFNGAIRVFAVAVNEARIAAAVQKTLVRGDLIVTPNAPTTVAPGDEFRVSVAVANNIEGSAAAAPVQVAIDVPPQLAVLGERAKTVNIAAGHEGAVSFNVQARQGEAAVLGNATLNFTAGSGGRSARMHSDISVRPASPKIAGLRFGSFKGSQDVGIERQLYPEYRNVSAGLSALPLVAITGLAAYLDNFAYGCTEQLLSKAIPALVLSKHPEFAAAENTETAQAAFEKLLPVLRARQNGAGGFGLWTASPQADAFASVYAVHVLLEARALGQAVPEDMLQKALGYIQNLAASPSDDLSGLRVRAYAAYLLTRQGMVTTAILASLREALNANFEEDVWRQDLAAVYLGAAYQLLQQQRAADELIEPLAEHLDGEAKQYTYEYYYDPLIRDAQTLYILARHFPERLRAMPPAFLQGIAGLLQQNVYNTLSSGYLLLAYSAYLEAVPAEATGQLAISAVDAAGNRQELPLPANLAPRAPFPPSTKTLHFSGPAGLPLYYAVAESGFDRQPPAAEVRNGLEIIRTHLDADGKPLDHAVIGQEVTVQLRLRAIDRDSIDNVAIQDLLPGGFEPVLQEVVEEDAQTGEETEEETQDGAASDETSGTEAAAENLPEWRDRLAVGGNWTPIYADVREDRVVLYGSVGRDMAEYRYRIRAASAGKFTVPPVYAEAMYESVVRAHSGAGNLIVSEGTAKSSVQKSPGTTNP